MTRVVLLFVYNKVLSSAAAEIIRSSPRSADLSSRLVGKQVKMSPTQVTEILMTSTDSILEQLYNSNLQRTSTSVAQLDHCIYVLYILQCICPTLLCLVYIVRQKQKRPIHMWISVHYLSQLVATTLLLVLRIRGSLFFLHVSSLIAEFVSSSLWTWSVSCPPKTRRCWSLGTNTG